VLDEAGLDMERRTAEGEKDSLFGMERLKGAFEVDRSLAPSSSVRDMREEEPPRSNCAVGISLLFVSC
jgi:hypothetical protein